MSLPTTEIYTQPPELWGNKFLLCLNHLVCGTWLGKLQKTNNTLGLPLLPELLFPLLQFLVKVCVYLWWRTASFSWRASPSSSLQSWRLRSSQRLMRFSMRPCIFQVSLTASVCPYFPHLYPFYFPNCTPCRFPASAPGSENSYCFLVFVLLCLNLDWLTPK